MFKKYKILQLKSLSHPKIKKFVKDKHYLHSLSRGNKEVYVLMVNNKIRGVAAFGQPVSKKYNLTHIELKRFCLDKGAPKNTCSWFMSKCIKQLKKTHYKKIITYADPKQGHEGIIYKASNFKYVGVQPHPTMALKIGKKLFHARGISCKKLKNMGKGKYIALPKKHIFEYNLKGQ